VLLSEWGVCYEAWMAVWVLSPDGDFMSAVATKRRALSISFAIWGPMLAKFIYLFIIFSFLYFIFLRCMYLFVFLFIFFFYLFTK